MRHSAGLLSPPPGRASTAGAADLLELVAPSSRDVSPAPTSGEEDSFDAENEPVVSLPEGEEEVEASVAQVSEALQNHVLFRGCKPGFLKGLTELAKRRVAPPLEKFEGGDSAELLVVGRGAVQATVRTRGSLAVATGPGTTLNAMGFCRLRHEVADFTRRSSTWREEDEQGAHQSSSSTNMAGGGGPATGYVLDAPSASRVGTPDSVREWRRAEKALQWRRARNSTLSTSIGELVLFGLCPYGTVTRTMWKRARLLQLKTVFAPSSQRASRARRSCSAQPLEELGGAVLTVIPSLLALQDLVRSQRRVGVPHFQESMEIVDKNIQERKAIWRSLMKPLTQSVLPGAPADVVWEIAEVAQLASTNEGSSIVEEGAFDEDLIIITEGVVSVERRVGWKEDGKPTMAVVGRLFPGAIIGDLALLGLGLSRIATARAKTCVSSVRIPAAGLLAVLARYPGALQSCDSWVNGSAEFMRESLPTGTEVLRSLRLFAGCGMPFMSDLASLGQRQVKLFDTLLVEEGSSGGILFVVEVGKCAVEVKGKGTVAEVPAGNCFGERTLLGSAASNASVRVTTPFALVYMVSQAMFEAALQRHPEEREHFEQIKSEPTEGRVKGSKLKSAELFRFCSEPFLDMMADSTFLRTYLPGQSIVVEGDTEEDVRMFVLKGGLVAAEIDGKQVSLLPHGATFGELAFLDPGRPRATTLRAVTLSTLLEVPRSAYDAALEAFPEEEQRFKEGIGQALHGGSKVTWPFLDGADSRFIFLVDLHAGRKRFSEGDASLGEAPHTEAAVLILSGTAAVVDKSGNELMVLTGGACFNEKVLLTDAAAKDKRLVPKTELEVRLLTRENLVNALAEFPEATDSLNVSIVSYMAKKYEKRLGFEPGGCHVLRETTAFFRRASEEVLQDVAGLLRPEIFGPGEHIAGKAIAEHEDREFMHILLDGSAILEEPAETTPMPVGKCFGEAVVLGVAKRYPGKLMAQTVCTVFTLYRSDLEEALSKHPGDLACLQSLRSEASLIDYDRVRRLLVKSDPFGHVNEQFLSAVCPRAHIVLFPPDALIMTAGEECKLGETCFYVLLAGKVQAEGSIGTTLATISKGKTFGEMGAFGLTARRTASARASAGGLVACARIGGMSILHALEANPEARNMLTDHFRKQEAANRATESRRRGWIQTVAVPGLARTKFFAGCSEAFLQDIALTVSETQHPAGEVLAVIGKETNAMLVILSGTVEILSLSGAKVGSLAAGATFGDVACLGLFPRWMATLRASTACRVIGVPESALRRALAGPSAGGLAEGLERLVDERRDQVARGLPLRAMPGLNVDASEASVRVIGLLSEMMVLSSGEMWQPEKDEGPCGAMVTIVYKGRAQVEAKDGQNVMTLVPGILVAEGLVASAGGRIRAEGSFEAYRFRRSDFELAVASDGAAQRWLYQFKLQERQDMDRLRNRLSNAQGLSQTSVPHEKDREIQTWTAKRSSSTSRAFKIREERANLYFEPLAPERPPDGFMPLQAQGHSQGQGQGQNSSRLERRQSSRIRPPSHVETNRGLVYYPVVKLPKLPKLASKGGGVNRSCSLPQLPEPPARLVL